MSANSPLRYPGGKGRLSRFIADLLSQNKLVESTYIEPFAGGAGVALSLLFGGFVSRVIINDANKGIAAFWKSITSNCSAFLSLLEKTPVDMENYLFQRKILANSDDATELQLGFATFFLNRANRSGILNAGPIGGYEQHGKWGLDARFKKTILKDRIVKINLFRNRIDVHNRDALDLLKEMHNELNSAAFVYLDPPYFGQGKRLYLDYYIEEDHIQLADYLASECSFPWVLTYDNHPKIREEYENRNYQVDEFSVHYSANRVRNSSELMIISENLEIPNSSNIHFQ